MVLKIALIDRNKPLFPLPSRGRRGWQIRTLALPHVVEYDERSAVDPGYEFL